MIYFIVMVILNSVFHYLCLSDKIKYINFEFIILAPKNIGQDPYTILFLI